MRLRYFPKRKTYLHPANFKHVALLAAILFLLTGCYTGPEKFLEKRATPEKAKSIAQASMLKDARPDVVIKVQKNGIRISYKKTKEGAALVHGLKARTIQTSKNCLDLRSSLIHANEIFIREDRCSLFSRYPLLVNIDERGWLLFAPYLFDYDSRVSFRGIEQFVILPGARQAMNGFIFFGPMSSVYQSEGVSVIGNIHSRVEIHKTVVMYTNFWTQLLGQPSSEPIVIVPSLESQGLQAAHASDNGVIVIPDELSFNDRLISHELFHLWNGPNFKDDEAELNRWLLEGVADYAALLSVVAVSGASAESSSFLSSSLNSCRTVLRQRSLTNVLTVNDSEQVNRLHYSCGLAIAWFADSEIVSKSNGNKSLFHTLKKLYAQSAGYTVENLLFTLRNEIGENSLAENLLSSQRDADWNFAISKLKNFNQELANVITEESLRTAIVMKVAAGLCPNQAYGYETSSDGSIFLDVDSSCAAIRPNTEVVSVEGYRLQNVTLKVGTEILQKCSENLSVTVVLAAEKGDRPVRVACSAIGFEPKKRLVAAPDWRRLISAAKTVGG